VNQRIAVLLCSFLPGAQSHAFEILCHIGTEEYIGVVGSIRGWGVEQLQQSEQQRYSEESEYAALIDGFIAEVCGEVADAGAEIIFSIGTTECLLVDHYSLIHRHTQTVEALVDLLQIACKTRQNMLNKINNNKLLMH